MANDKDLLCAQNSIPEPEHKGGIGTYEIIQNLIKKDMRKIIGKEGMTEPSNHMGMGKGSLKLF